MPKKISKHDTNRGLFSIFSSNTDNNQKEDEEEHDTEINEHVSKSFTDFFSNMYHSLFGFSEEDAEENTHNLKTQTYFDIDTEPKIKDERNCLTVLDNMIPTSKTRNKTVSVRTTGRNRRKSRRTR